MTHCNIFLYYVPCGRTLWDYKHFIEAGIGAQTDVTRQLLSAAKMNTLEDYQKYVALIFDEMKIKEGCYIASSLG